MKPNAEDLIVTAKVQELLKLSYKELDELFSKSTSGDIPIGPAVGTAIIGSGADYSDEIAAFIRIFAWQGKTFHQNQKTLVNRILPFGLEAILADVYLGQSWFDKKECIVLDYSKTSLVAHWIRDEIRTIDKDIYLGKVYWDDKPLIHFSLEFNT